MRAKMEINSTDLSYDHVALHDSTKAAFADVHTDATRRLHTAPNKVSER
jgi:hypothetical protein